MMIRTGRRQFPILLATIAALALAMTLLFSPIRAQEGSAPAKPRGLEAAAAHGQVVLTWDDPNDDSITGYVVLRRVRVNDQGGDFNVLVANTESAATTHTDNEVAASTTYTYRIKAINEHGTSERSRWYHIATPAAPEPAANSPATGAPAITGTAQVGQTLTVDTSGIADEDGLEDAAFGYQWLADGTAMPGATASAYTPAEADEGKPVTVQVSFTDDAGNDETLTSAPTAAVAAAPPTEPPAKPADLSATATHNQVVLTWKDPNDDSITGYVVLRRVRVNDQGGNFDVLVADTGTAALTYADDTVAASLTYTYRIKAINGAGTSERSRWYHIDTPAAPEPETDPADLAPANLAAELTGGQVVLTWDSPAEDAGSVTGYEILRGEGTDVPATLAADTGNTAATYTDATATTASESYAYRVKALRGQEKSQSSNEAVIQLPDPPSSAPGGLTAQYGSSGVVLAWNAPSENAASVTGYEILRAEGGGERTILVKDTGNTATTYTDGAATQPSATYAYRVRAIRDEEKSADSNEARVHLPPSAPLQVLSTATHVSVVLLWADPQDPAIVGYRILRREPAADDPGEFAVLTENTGSATTSYTDTDVAPSTSYAYRVQAISPHGVSVPSRDVPVDTPAIPEPLRTLPAETKQLDGTSDEATVSEPEGEDFPSSTATRGYVAIGESATGEIGRPGDWDAFRIELDSGVTYQIDVKGDATADGTLIDPYLRRLKDADGNNVPGTSNDNANDMLNSQLLFTPEQSGSYYIQIKSAVREGYAATGTYTVSVRLEGAAEEAQTDLLAADASTILLLGVGDEITQTIDYFADEDWIKVILTAGTSYSFTVTGGWADDSLTLEIPQVGLFDSASQPRLMYRGDRQATAWTQFEGVDGVATGYHKAEKDGTYYVSVSSRSDVGTYRVSVQEVPESAYHSGAGVGQPHGPEAHYHPPGVVWVREFLAWCPRDMEQGTVGGIPVEGGTHRTRTVQNTQYGLMPDETSVRLDTLARCVGVGEWGNNDNRRWYRLFDHSSASNDVPDLGELSNSNPEIIRHDYLGVSREQDWTRFSVSQAGNFCVSVNRPAVTVRGNNGGDAQSIPNATRVYRERVSKTSMSLDFANDPAGAKAAWLANSEIVRVELPPGSSPTAFFSDGTDLPLEDTWHLYDGTIDGDNYGGFVGDQRRVVHHATYKEMTDRQFQSQRYVQIDGAGPHEYFATVVHGGTGSSGNGEYVLTISLGKCLPHSMMENGNGRSVPPPPQNLRAVQGKGTVELAWDAPDGAGVTGYRIERRPADGQGSGPQRSHGQPRDHHTLVEDTGSADTGYTDESAEQGVEYEYRVTARNESGAGEGSDWVRADPEPASNTPATGAPTITGKAQVGETLTADITGISDADGLSGETFTYQWVSGDGTTDTDIEGATGSTYKLVDADQGRSVRVRVTFTDDGGNEETLTSTPTGPVFGDGLPGTPRNLTATAGDREVTLSWELPEDNGNPPAARYRIEWRIDGKDYDKNHWGTARSTTYTTNDQANLANGVKYFFRVKAENDDGNSHGPYGPASEEVSATPTSGSAVDLGTPVLSNMENLHHRMVRLDWQDIEDAGWYVVQYYNIDGGSGEWLDLPAEGVDIAFHGSSAVLSNLHGLSWLRVGAASCDGASEWSQIEELYGTNASDWEGVPVPEVEEGDEIEPCPVVLGTPVLSDTEYLHHGMVQLDWQDIEDAGWYVVQHYHVKDGEWLDLPAAGVEIAFHGSSAVLSNLHGLSWLRVGAASCAGASEWSQIEQLFGTNASDWEGVPVPEVAEGDEIEPCSEDVDTSDNSPATGAPAIGGTAQVGETLMADTSGIADADGLSNVQYEYQWFADDTAIAGATGSTYTLVAEDEGKAITVQVSFTDDADNEETLTSEATDAVAAAPTPNSPATGAPTISGTAQVGETLTADASGIADADG